MFAEDFEVGTIIFLREDNEFKYKVIERENTKVFKSLMFNGFEIDYLDADLYEVAK